jgi:hypothetical protein
VKVLVFASVLDLSMPYGCTPAWWQLMKAMHENGAEILAAPYHGPPVSSLWWRSYDNPCLDVGRRYSAFRRVREHLPARSSARANRMQRRVELRLIHARVTPRWREHLGSILSAEPDVDAVLVLTVPLNHLPGIATYVRERFGIPVCYFDGDVPASLPAYGGFDSGFDMYHGADLSEYDLVLSNSKGSEDTLRQLGARRTGTLWWAADPSAFRPVEAQEDIDVFFYGLGTEHREEWLRTMITIPSLRLPHRRFVVAGDRLDMDLGRAERLGPIPPSQLSHLVARSRVQLNVARSAHASVYASATTRLFELAAMRRTIVSNPLEGIHEWFEPGRELEVVDSADGAAAAYERLLQDDVRRKSLADAAHARVLKDHTFDHRARELLRHLESLKAPNVAPSSVPRSPR